MTIEATIGSTTRSATTGSAGTATVTQIPTGTVSVRATAEGFGGGTAQNVTVNANATTNVTFTLERPPPPPPATGQIAATVVDQFDAPINGVTITATIDNTTRTATTGSAGTATVTQVPAGSVSVTASADGLVDPPAQTVTVTEDGTANVEFTMQRVVEAAGGISRAVVEDPLSVNGDTFTFRISVIVIDENFNPVPGLTASAFSLADCTPVQPEFPERPDCVRFGSPGDDAPYTVANATPAEFQEIADPPGPVPYAAGLLFDSSASIADSDPTDARIFATKEYLNDVATPDLVMLAAFADQEARRAAQ